MAVLVQAPRPSAVARSPALSRRASLRVLAARQLHVRVKPHCWLVGHPLRPVPLAAPPLAAAAACPSVSPLPPTALPQLDGGAVVFAPEQRRPKGVVHFLGGAFVASTPHLIVSLMGAGRGWWAAEGVVGGPNLRRPPSRLHHPPTPTCLPCGPPPPPPAVPAAPHSPGGCRLHLCGHPLCRDVQPRRLRTSGARGVRGGAGGAAGGPRRVGRAGGGAHPRGGPLQWSAAACADWSGVPAGGRRQQWGGSRHSGSRHSGSGSSRASSAASSSRATSQQRPDFVQQPAGKERLSGGSCGRLPLGCCGAYIQAHPSPPAACMASRPLPFPHSTAAPPR